MHVVFDAFAVRAGSAAVILENLLIGWRALEPGDRLTLVASDEPGFPVPDGIRVEIVPAPLPGTAGSLWLRSRGVRRAVRRLRADALISGVTASALTGAGCPRAVMLTDLRHEVRPAQFGRGRKLARKLGYGWSFRTADSILCISERTLGDLRRRHPSVGSKGVAAVLGADHVDAWPRVGRAEPPYALAFGHFENKHAAEVLAGWAEFCDDDDTWSLRLVGLSDEARRATVEQAARLGISDRVQLMPWLDEQEFRECFAGAGLVVFPSDFEGFGLPAVEALRLGIPLVISDDPALAEVTGGHAEVAEEITPERLAACMRRALRRTPEQLDEARTWTDRFTWRATAAVARSSLVSLGGYGGPTWGRDRRDRLGGETRT